MKKQFIFFDFDGVIADSLEPAFEIQHRICPNMTEEMYRSRFDGNVNDWKSSLNICTPECQHDIDFVAEYSAKLAGNSVQIVSEMDKAVAELAEKYELVIISSTNTEPIKTFLSAHNLDHCFLEILGNDVHKSKIEKMKLLFDKYGLESKDCLFITDTLGDLREAAAVDVGAIAVSWGFHMKDKLHQGKFFRLVDTPNELVQVVDDYFGTF